MKHGDIFVSVFRFIRLTDTIRYIKKQYDYKNNSITDKNTNNYLIFNIKQNTTHSAAPYCSGVKSKLILQYNFKTRCNGSIDD